MPFPSPSVWGMLLKSEPCCSLEALPCFLSDLCSGVSFSLRTFLFCDPPYAPYLVLVFPYHHKTNYLQVIFLCISLISILHNSDCAVLTAAYSVPKTVSSTVLSHGNVVINGNVPTEYNTNLPATCDYWALEVWLKYGWGTKILIFNFFLNSHM